MAPSGLFSVGVALAATSLAPAFAQTVYADANLTTGANDGSSWADAFQGPSSLQNALVAATAGVDIWVADGIYVPALVGSRSLSFEVKSNVNIYGGFSGGETSVDMRPAFGVAESILSGDLAGDDDSGGSNAENSLHVLDVPFAITSAIIDGFTVTGGNADLSGDDRGGGMVVGNGSSPTIRNVRFDRNRSGFGGGACRLKGSPRLLDCSFIDNFSGNSGGAIYLDGASSPAIDSCFFTGNMASTGGAYYAFSTPDATVTNSVFVENIATSTGGGGGLLIRFGGRTRIVNCTIVRNSATNQAQGGIRDQGADVFVENCIVWNNTGIGGAQNGESQVNSAADVNYSIVEGGFASGIGNLNVDPMFADLAGGDLHLGPISGAVDAGNSMAVPAGVVADFDGKPRFIDNLSVPNTGAGSMPYIDLGAFERSAPIGSAYCSAALNSTGLAGRINAAGSTSIGTSDVTLTASQLPMNSFGFFIVSRTTGFVANPGGSSGNLCLSGSIGRYVASGQIQNTGLSGSFSLMIDLTGIPQPTMMVPVIVGDSWSFQAWHRDSLLGVPTSNLTDGVTITFNA